MNKKQLKDALVTGEIISEDLLHELIDKSHNEVRKGQAYSVGVELEGGNSDANNFYMSWIKSGNVVQLIISGYVDEDIILPNQVQQFGNRRVIFNEYVEQPYWWGHTLEYESIGRYWKPEGVSEDCGLFTLGFYGDAYFLSAGKHESEGVTIRSGSELRVSATLVLDPEYMNEPEEWEI